MNIDAYNLDSLRALVRKLEKENQNLKQKLDEANIPYISENIFAISSTENTEYDLDVIHYFIINLSYLFPAK